MRLTAQEAENFIKYRLKKNVPKTIDYQTKNYDIVEIYFKEKGWFRDKERIETIEFRRSETPTENEKYITVTMDSDCVKLVQHLQDLQDEKFKIVTLDQYMFLKDNLAEDFI